MSAVSTEASDTLVARLRKHSALSEADVIAISALSPQLMLLKRKRDFQRPDDYSQHCYILVSGRVGAFEQGRSGARQITSLYLPGQLVNSDWPICDTYTRGLTALSETIVAAVRTSDMASLAEARPRVAVAFWRESLLDTAIKSRWMFTIAHLGARPRTAHFICELSTRLGGVAGPAMTFDCSLTQADIAEMVGITSVHINRTLRSLREAGLVSIWSGIVTIHDWTGLAQLAEFEPAYLHLRREPPISEAARTRVAHAHPL